MAKAAATFLVLLSCLWPTVQVQAESHVLSCSFTVEARSISTNSTSQCSVDGVSLLSDDKDNTRKGGNAPKECADLFSKLKDIEEDLRSQLHTMELEGDLTRGDHSLQVTVVYQDKEGKPIDAYWNFTLDGHHSFRFNCFDSKNKKCAVFPNNTPGVDKWQNNTNLLRHLETFIRGDSRHCFLEILPQSKKRAGSTSWAPDIGNVTSPSQLPSTMNTTQLPSTMNTTQLPSTMNTTQLPSTTQPPSKEGSSITAVVIPIVSVSVLSVIGICIYKCVKRKSRPQGGKMCSKLCILDSCVFGTRRGQHTPSAVGEPCPEETICMAVMSPLEGDSPHCSSASSS